MSQVTIENPILNSPFQAPARHFRFNNDGITTDIEEKRRASAFFMPIAHARKKGEQALLEYWSNPARERKLFFCQREAVETAVYLAEVAARYGDAWIENYLRDTNSEYNAGLPRVAFKMVTGSGKTVVMAMLIGLAGAE